jgi:hypothetical protein
MPQKPGIVERFSHDLQAPGTITKGEIAPQSILVNSILHHAKGRLMVIHMHEKPGKVRKFLDRTT